MSDNTKKEFIEMEDFTITITLDNDLEVECAVVATFEVEERDYIALLPLNHHDKLDPEEVFLYRFSIKEGQEGLQLDNIETDEEYNKVADVFDELVDACEE